MTRRHLCEPGDPHAVALANTWIPTAVKEYLVSLFDQGVGAAEGHTRGLEMADCNDLPTAWEQSDVKNFFDTLNRWCGEDQIIAVLEELVAAGHFVAFDYKEVPVSGTEQAAAGDGDGAAAPSPSMKKTLNAVFFASRSMQAVERLFGLFSTFDTTYAKNKLQLPVAFFVGKTNDGCLIPFATVFVRSETIEKYAWVMRSYVKCYGRLPACMVVDGDVKIHSSVRTVSQECGKSVALVLCIWHLHQELEKNMLKKVPDVDVFALKKAFYDVRGAATEAEFDTPWNKFLDTME